MSEKKKKLAEQSHELSVGQCQLFHVQHATVKFKHLVQRSVGFHRDGGAIIHDLRVVDQLQRGLGIIDLGLVSVVENRSMDGGREIGDEDMYFSVAHDVPTHAFALFASLIAGDVRVKMNPS